MAASREGLVKSWLAASPEERKRLEVAALITLQISMKDLARELRRIRREQRELHEEDDDG